jgi:hypothetical protein
MIITAKDFRTSQSRYIGAAYRGEEVVVKAKAGSFKITPVLDDAPAEKKRDFATELRGALLQVKDAIEGKRKLKTAEELLYELRNSND